MVSGQAIPEAVHWIVIRLSTAMTPEDVAMHTDLGLSSVKKILAYFRKTGGVNVPERLKPQVHRSLCDYHVEVCGSPLQISTWPNSVS